jgi:hypothetical protein
MLRSPPPVLLLALAVGACSSSPPVDAEGGTTTSPGSTTSDATTDGSGEDGSGEDTETSSGPSLDLPAMPVACDVWLQDCLESEKCVPYASEGGTWDAFQCVPILGEGQLGDACIWDGHEQATDDCGPGLMCWEAIELAGQLVGRCAALCEGTADNSQCAGGTSCVMPNYGPPAVCGTLCDPLSQDCPEGVACTWGFSDFICVATKGVALGQPCEFFDDCEAGTMCILGEFLPRCEGSRCCAAFCDLHDPLCTTPGTECVSFFEEGIVWDIGDEGVCVIPE